MDITNEMIERAANAIEECMANDGWQVSGINRVRLKKCVRFAAEKALNAAINYPVDIGAIDRRAKQIDSELPELVYSWTGKRC